MPASSATCARPRPPFASSPASIRGRGSAARSATGTTIRGCSRRSIGPAIATYHWDVEPDDWRPERTPAEVERSVIDGALAHGDGAVVLLHSWPAATIAALPAILTGLRGGGAALVRLDEVAAEPAHRDRCRRRQLEDRRRHPRRDRPGARHVARAWGVVLAPRPRPLDREPRRLGARGRTGGGDRGRSRRRHRHLLPGRRRPARRRPPHTALAARARPRARAAAAKRHVRGHARGRGARLGRGRRVRGRVQLHGRRPGRARGAVPRARADLRRRRWRPGDRDRSRRRLHPGRRRPRAAHVARAGGAGVLRHAHAAPGHGRPAHGQAGRGPALRPRADRARRGERRRRCRRRDRRAAGRRGGGAREHRPAAAAAAPHRRRRGARRRGRAGAQPGVHAPADRRSSTPVPRPPASRWSTTCPSSAPPCSGSTGWRCQTAPTPACAGCSSLPDSSETARYPEEEPWRGSFSKT